MQYIACTHTRTHVCGRASTHVDVRHFAGTQDARGGEGHAGGGAGREDLVVSAKVRPAEVHGPPLLLIRLRSVACGLGVRKTAHLPKRKAANGEQMQRRRCCLPSHAAAPSPLTRALRPRARVVRRHWGVAPSRLGAHSVGCRRRPYRADERRDLRSCT